MTRLLLVTIKAVHTVAFAGIAGSILVVFADGIRGRPRRRTAVASGIALAECAVFAANGFVCPLTPLAERYGAKRGSVTDIFLPDVIARNLTWIATPILVVGLLLNARVLIVRRRGRASGPAARRARPGPASANRVGVPSLGLDERTDRRRVEVAADHPDGDDGVALQERERGELGPVVGNLSDPGHVHRVRALGPF